MYLFHLYYFLINLPVAFNFLPIILVLRFLFFNFGLQSLTRALLSS